MTIARRQLLLSGVAGGLVLALAACSKDDDSDPVSEAVGGSISVSGTIDEAPEVTFTSPLEVPDALVAKTIIEGDGDVPAEDATIAYALFQKNGSTGEDVYSSWDDDGTQATLQLSADAIDASLYKVIKGKALGSRLLIAQPYTDQSTGSTSAQVIVIDLVAVVPTRAEGDAQEPDPALPAFTLAEDGAPQLTAAPTGDAPGETQVAVTIKGKGQEVKAGDTVVFAYSGWKWSDGSSFDSSWDRGDTFSSVIGSGQVIAAWDDQIPGHTVGSQLEIVAPPADAYGGTDSELKDETLIFVLDILYVL